MSVIKSQVKSVDEISISKILDILLRRWYYIPLALALAGSFAKIYLRYSKPVYEALGTIKIEDENSYQTLGFQDFGYLNSNIMAEMQVLQSRSIVRKAIERMQGIDVSYYQIGNILTSEIYTDCPFRVKYDSTSNIIYSRLLGIEPVGNNAYDLVVPAGETETKFRYNLGEVVDLNGFRFKVVLNEAKSSLFTEGKTFKFMINNIDHLVSRAQKGLKIEQAGFMVSILKITCQDNVPGFAADFVNALASVYVEEDKDIKTKAASQALAFIEEQLDTLEKKVRQSEVKLEEYKKANEIISIEQKGNTNLARLSEAEAARLALELEKHGLTRLEKEMKKSVDDLGPFTYSLGGTGGSSALANLVQTYNNLVDQRIEDLKIYSDESPYIQSIDQTIMDVKASINKALSSQLSALDSTIGYYDVKILEYRKDLEEIPRSQRDIVNLEREYKVNESVFNTLLEKRAESSIAKASIVSSVRIVDPARTPRWPISPNRNKIYFIAALMGLGVSLIIILITGLLKNTISYKEEIAAISLTPIIGEVRRAPASIGNKYPKLIVHKNPKSAFSESIRAIRTNLQFIAPGKKGKMMAITSTVSGEGKSFITINLAGIISMLNKKVLILDLDLRKPKLHYSFGVDNSKGLSTYLVGNHDLDDMLYKTEYENLDMIPSGPIPPNPSELIYSMRMDLLLMELGKRYDYLIIDTPPIGLVTDGMSILSKADVSLYVLRADYSRRAYATFPDELVEDHNIKNLFIIMNSVSKEGTRYGKYGKYGAYGKYGSSGYYVEEEKKPPRWMFWKWFK